MISRLIPIVAKIGQCCEAGRKIAQAAAGFCAAGALAAAAFLSQLVGIDGEKQETQEEGDEPP